MKLTAVLGDTKSNPFVLGYLCNGWGAETTIQVKLKLSDIEV